MKAGTVISAAAHLGLIALAVWGYDQIADDPVPVTPDPVDVVQSAPAEVGVGTGAPATPQPVETATTTQPTPQPTVRPAPPEPVQTVVVAPQTSPAPPRRPVRTVEADPAPVPTGPVPTAPEQPESTKQETVEQETVEQEASEQEAAQTEPAVPEPVEVPVEPPQPAETAQAQAEPAGAEPEVVANEGIDVEGTGTEITAPAPQGPRLNIAERNAIRLAVQKFYTYAGDRSDRQLSVVMRIELDLSGQLTGQPEMLSARGGSRSAQHALFAAGARAVRKAAAAGEFTDLPPEKHGHWGVMVIRLGIDAFGVAS